MNVNNFTRKFAAQLEVLSPPTLSYSCDKLVIARKRTVLARDQGEGKCGGLALTAGQMEWMWDIHLCVYSCMSRAQLFHNEWPGCEVLFLG